MALWLLSNGEEALAVGVWVPLLGYRPDTFVLPQQYLPEYP